MKLNLLILSIVIAAAMGLTLWLNNHLLTMETVQEVSKNQESAPPFSYQTIEGRKATLSDHQGKVVMLHFWASWCAPCIIEFPDLIKLAENHPDDFIILAISLDKKKSDITKFLKKLKKPILPNFIIAQDTDSHISKELYGTIKLPESFFISPTGVIQQKVVGPQEDWNNSYWNRRIDTFGSE